MYDPIAKKMPDVYPLEEEDSTDEPIVTGSKPPAKPGLNDRKSPRYRVPKERQSCEVKAGANVILALLVDNCTF